MDHTIALDIAAMVKEIAHDYELSITDAIEIVDMSLSYDLAINSAYADGVADVNQFLADLDRESEEDEAELLNTVASN